METEKTFYRWFFIFSSSLCFFYKFFEIFLFSFVCCLRLYKPPESQGSCVLVFLWGSFEDFGASIILLIGLNQICLCFQFTMWAVDKHHDLSPTRSEKYRLGHTYGKWAEREWDFVVLMLSCDWDTPYIDQILMNHFAHWLAKLLSHSARFEISGELSLGHFI